MKKQLSNALGTLAGIICLVLASQLPAAPLLPAINEPASGTQLPGKFTWFDLATPAINDQKSFYGDVFGWTFSPLSNTGDSYTLILNKGSLIGGMFEFSPSKDVADGAVWVSLISVESTEKAEQVVKDNGGQLELAAQQVPNRGRHALFRDPAGALFGVLLSDSGDPADYEVAIGEFIWVDLFARDVREMAAFYQKLAPYEVTSDAITEDVSRVVLRAHGMARAGIVPVDEEANRSAWVPYVRVEDVAATLEKVIAGGGFAIIPPDERLLNGNVAVFVDPNGGVTGILKWDYEKEAASEGS